MIPKEAGGRALLGRGALQEFGAPGQASSEFVYVDPDDNSVRRCGPTTVWKHWAFTDLGVKGLGAGEVGECAIRILRVPTEAERLRDPDNETPVFGLVGSRQADEGVRTTRGFAGDEGDNRARAP